MFYCFLLPHGYISTDSRKIAPEENCSPAAILTLVLNQTLTLTGGQISLGAVFRTPLVHMYV